ncbi:hypothetical protein AB0E65_14810 [Streptomyces fragilis]|uniref:Transmembrane protein n=2 Tax=Streptomyces fragilis TaxID=67301 RepID=A0ABV2YIC5_9ACTN|nr:hypothetical protein [Streptomyces fragilis]
MEAGPRDTAHGRQVADGDRGRDDAPAPGATDLPGAPSARATDDLFPTQGLGEPTAPDADDDGVGDEDGVSDDGPPPEEMFSGPEVEIELRPRRRLSAWHLAPVVGLAAAGSLMFAFPLAFDFGDSGAVIAMLGVLICSCAAGWGLVAARRVGQNWPGLPPRGSGRRPDWRVALAYAVIVAAVVLLAVWRVARLR